MSRAAASFGILLCLLLLVAAVNCSDQGNCSTTCIVEQCDSKINLSISLISWVDAKIDLINLGMFDKSAIGIKYGKYCGVGYWGCAGEKPCDDLDACCMAHDNCVDKFGISRTFLFVQTHFTHQIYLFLFSNCWCHLLNSLVLVRVYVLSLLMSAWF